MSVAEQAISEQTQPRPFDIWLALPIFALLSIGVVMVYSASVWQGLSDGNTLAILNKELVWVGLGLLAFCITATVDYRTWIRVISPMVVLSLISLALLYVPGFGAKINGAIRWYRFGGLGIQPSEFAKLILVIYLAYNTARKGDRIRNFKVGFLPPSIVAGCFVALVVKQPDLGTSAVIALMSFSMLFVAGARVSFILGVFVAATPVIYHQLMGVDWRQKRILAYLDPWKYEENYGYQLTRALKALGNGGIEGSGLGNSKVKLGFLPEAHNDFIVPIIGEELGFLGVALVMGLFALIAWRGYRLYYRCPDRYGALLAFGITTWIGSQALINLGVVTGLLPTKGITLPLVSYGGSSMIATMAALGLLLNISAMDPPPRRIMERSPT